MNTYLLFLCGEAPRTLPFAIFLQINYLQIKVHNPQFLLNLSLREEIPLPLPHVLDTFFSLFLMLGLLLFFLWFWYTHCDMFLSRIICNLCIQDLKFPDPSSLSSTLIPVAILSCSRNPSPPGYRNNKKSNFLDLKTELTKRCIGLRRVCWYSQFLKIPNFTP
jgi:hypothetical protein